MNLPLYEYSLCIALPLMIFFGAYFLLAPTPDKAIFANYLRSRRIMGCALLLLAVNHAVHFFFEVRLRDVHAAILMNLSTYFLCYWLFSSALTSLLDRFYLTHRRWHFHLSAWVLFTLLSGVILLGLPEGAAQRAGLTVMAAWLVGYGLWLARRLIRAYRRAVRLFDDTHSDDIGAYIRWMSVFTWWAVIFGVGCGLLTFLPDRYVFLWILSSVPFYIYLYCSYMNTCSSTSGSSRCSRRSSPRRRLLRRLRAIRATGRTARLGPFIPTLRHGSPGGLPPTATSDRG